MCSVQEVTQPQEKERSSGYWGHLPSRMQSIEALGKEGHDFRAREGEIDTGGERAGTASGSKKPKTDAL